MTSVTFARGGVHPPEGKSRTASNTIELLEAPAEVVIPLSQHIGAPAKACVEKGDDVAMGQEIGTPGGFVSARIHASVSGKVKTVEPRPGMMGVDVLSVVIENDGEDRAVEMTGQGAGWDEAAPDALRGHIEKAGLVGMGGATFPTHVKMSPPPAKPIDTVILNGAECEPMLTADHRLMLERTDEIVTGLLIAMRILGATRGFIGIEQNKPDAIETMRSAVSGRGVEVLPLKVKYPQGAEKQLIHAALGREVPSGGLPMDVGVVVQNVGTAQAISDAVLHGRPLYERVVTVSGSAIARGGNLKVRIGTPVSKLIEACGGPKGEVGKLVAGGPMMGFSQYTDEVAVTKGTSGILLFSKDEVPTASPDPCIRCGRCIRACPMGISPTDIAAYARNEMVEETSSADALDCIECGSCAFGCPARIPLVQEIRLGKALIAASKRKQK